MVGRVRRHSDQKMFFVDGKMVRKNWPANKNQKAIQINDWVHIKIDDEMGWGKYLGGDTNNKASYDIPNSINPQDFPDL